MIDTWTTYPSRLHFLLEVLVELHEVDVYTAPMRLLTSEEGVELEPSAGRCTADSLYSVITTTPSISLLESRALDADLMSIKATLALSSVLSLRGSNLTLCTFP